MTPIHLRTTAFSFPSAYLIKPGPKVTSNKKPVVHLHSPRGSCVQAGAYVMFVLTTHFALEGTTLRSPKVQHVCGASWEERGELTYIVEVAVGSPFGAVSAFQGARL